MSVEDYCAEFFLIFFFGRSRYIKNIKKKKELQKQKGKQKN